ncbi:MAG: hypothetical protein ACSW8G_07055 [Bacillota bacterium]
MAETKQTIEITAARALNPRSLRLEFSNGDVRLFDSHRLRGPAFIPLMNEDIFTKPIVTEDGKLGWEGLDITCSAKYIYERSVHYDDHAVAKEYVKTRRDIIGERIAIVLFPIMAIAGIIGTVWWYINN